MMPQARCGKEIESLDIEQCHYGKDSHVVKAYNLAIRECREEIRKALEEREAFWKNQPSAFDSHRGYLLREISDIRQVLLEPKVESKSRINELLGGKK